nr:hypothetical transcript [Hymenolepis microstoma]
MNWLMIMLSQNGIDTNGILKNIVKIIRIKEAQGKIPPLSDYFVSIAWYSCSTWRSNAIPLRQSTQSNSVFFERFWNSNDSSVRK